VHMNPELVLVRLGELTLKGRNRQRFERAVLQHIKRALGEFPELEYKPEFGRVKIYLNGRSYSDIAGPLAAVFGISSFSPVYAASLEPEALQAAAVGLMQALEPAPRTFKVSVRRVNKSYPYDTHELNRLLGGCILRALPGIKVDVHRPDIELKAEIRSEGALFYHQVTEGAGGFPVGTNGKAALMLSGGIDSPVAGYLAMRQGLELEAVHFHSYPYTSERSQDKVKDLARKLSQYAGGPVRLHMVPLTDLQTAMHRAYGGNLYITLLRRSMMRIAARIAEANGAGAIVTGESLGQVASQTLPSMNAINAAVRIPVIRPLVCMEKREIIRLSERIGTYEISILPHEDCCTLFLPPNPSTNPKLKVVESMEDKMPWLKEAEDSAILRTETVHADAERTEDDALSAFF